MPHGLGTVEAVHINVQRLGNYAFMHSEEVQQYASTARPEPYKTRVYGQGERRVENYV